MASFLSSRRTILGGAAAGLALWPGLSRADAPPQPSLTEPENIQGRSDDADRLTIKVMIGDKGPYRFVVDTGADRTVLADDVAAGLGLIPSDDVVVQGIARAVPARAVVLRDLKLGRIAIDALRTPVLPRQWLETDGYLGIDAIDGRRVSFDFQRHTLSVTPSAPVVAWPELNEAAIRVDGSHGRLTDVAARVDGVPAFAFIDTGAGISIGNTRLFDELQRKNNAAYLSNIRIPLFGVTGGEAEGRLVVVDKIKLGALNFTNALLVICDLSVFDVWGLAERPALFIGMNLLKKTSMFMIDYGRKELLFRLAQLRVARV